MTKISRQEALKIAKSSCVGVRENEIQSLVKELEQVLSYAERVQQVAADVEEPSTKNVNVFREDVAVKKNPEAILACAPEREERYFVVPKIIENS